MSRIPSNRARTPCNIDRMHPPRLLNDEYLHANTVEIKARSHNARRQSTNCTSGSYETLSGLSFDVQCDSDIPFHDLDDGIVDAVDINDCMQQCADSRPACYAVVYNHRQGFCYKKNNEASSESLSSHTDAHSAIAQSSQLEPLSTDCPRQNGSGYTTQAGMSFTIRCDSDYVLDDVKLNGRSISAIHTDTMDECLEFCAAGDPLCRAVAWATDLERGYNNCFPKNSSDLTSLSKPTYSTVHVATSPDSPPAFSCSDKTTLSAANGKTFDVQCARDVGGVDLRRFHSPSLQECVDGCAEYKNASSLACIAALFDVTWSRGYRNCIWKGVDATAQEPETDPYWAVALLTSNETTVTDTNNSNSTETGPSDAGSSGISGPADSGRSKSWIAGPVVGGVALLAILFALVYLYRRRINKRKGEQERAAWEQPELEGPGQNIERQGVVNHEVDGQGYSSELPVYERAHELQ